MWKWKEGGGCGVGGGGGGGYLHEVTEEKVIDGIVHSFACRAWACAPARHGGRGVKMTTRGNEWRGREVRKDKMDSDGIWRGIWMGFGTEWMDLSRTKWESA